MLSASNSHTEPDDNPVDVSAFSVKELKQAITDAGLSFKGLTEKSELRHRATEALRLTQGKANTIREQQKQVCCLFSYF